MPYLNPEDRRRAQARWKREKYARDRKFRHAESDRKAEWLQTPEGKELNLAASKRWLRKQKRAAKKTGKSRKRR